MATAQVKLLVGRLKHIKRIADRCRTCFGDGFGQGAMHLGRGIWAGRECDGCNGTGRISKRELRERLEALRNG